eukprot:80079_1
MGLMCSSSEPTPESITNTETFGSQRTERCRRSYSTVEEKGYVDHMDSTRNELEVIILAGTWKHATHDRNFTKIILKLVDLMDNHFAELVVCTSKDTGECTIYIEAESVSCTPSKGSDKYENAFATKIGYLLENYVSDSAYWEMTYTEKDYTDGNIKSQRSNAILQEPDEYPFSDESFVSVESDQNTVYLVRDDRKSTVMQMCLDIAQLESQSISVTSGWFRTTLCKNDEFICEHTFQPSRDYRIGEHISTCVDNVFCDVVNSMFIARLKMLKCK